MKKDKVYLRDILDAISDIEGFTRNLSEEAFYENKEKQYAVIRAIEIIGEATKNLSEELRTKHKEIPWKDMAGMRDKLIHWYFGVKLELVWGTIKSKIPELKNQVAKMLEDSENV